MTTSASVIVNNLFKTKCAQRCRVSCFKSKFIISYVLLMLVVFISRQIANRGVDKLAVVETSVRQSVRLSVSWSDHRIR